MIGGPKANPIDMAVLKKASKRPFRFCTWMLFSHVWRTSIDIKELRPKTKTPIDHTPRLDVTDNNIRIATLKIPARSEATLIPIIRSIPGKKNETINAAMASRDRTIPIVVKSIPLPFIVTGNRIALMPTPTEQRKTDRIMMGKVSSCIGWERIIIA
jgi:hypothetical protein